MVMRLNAQKAPAVVKSIIIPRLHTLMVHRWANTCGIHKLLKLNSPRLIFAWMIRLAEGRACCSLCAAHEAGQLLQLHPNFVGSAQRFPLSATWNPQDQQLLPGLSVLCFPVSKITPPAIARAFVGARRRARWTSAPWRAATPESNLLLCDRKRLCDSF